MNVEIVDMDEVELSVARAYASGWWLFLVAGIIWLLLGFVILSTRPSSISVTVILIALAFFMGGFTMFALAFVTSGAWKWMGIIGGVIAIGAGIAALVWPKPTLVVLGVFVAWYLLFRGIFDIAIALSNTHVRGWWLGLVAGIIAIGLGAWAIGNPERSTLLLITIIGIWTIFKGVFDLVAAFHYRGMKKALA